MSTERTPLDDKALWRSLSPPRPVVGRISDGEFAAWLEGGLGETEAARIEAAVAADPVLRQTALELADILGKPLPAAPARLTLRAQALVRGAEQPRRSWLARLLPDFSAGFAMQRGALAAMAVTVAAVGFMLGNGLSRQYEESSYASSQPTTGTTRSWGRDTTGELNDLFTDAT